MAEAMKTLVRETEDAPKTIGTAGAGTDNAVTVQTMPWYQMIAIRATRVYLQSLIGFLTAGGTGIAEAVGVPLDQFGGLLGTAATLAIAPAIMSVLTNALEFLTKLDVTNPGLRA